MQCSYVLYTGLLLTAVDAQSFVSECGIAVAQGRPLIVNGTRAKVGVFPWHVGIYMRMNTTENFEQICGGTLINSDLVVSAAHCFYDESFRVVMNASKFAVAAGKYYHLYNAGLLDSYAQKSLVRKIDVAEAFFGWSGNYAQDIALLRLETPFNMTALVKPICIDWNTRQTEQLLNGNTGKVVGWGKTETGYGSVELREINLPFIPRQTCVAAVPEEFKGLVTADKFCAGYRNGSSLCNGDSGGGLCFQFNGRWYLHGIVSTGPTSNGTCDSNHYTTFTNVGRFLGWIRTAYDNAGNSSEGRDWSIDYASTAFCILPEQPIDGRFRLGLCRGECHVVPGSRVPFGSALFYQCNEGYSLKGNNVSFCYNNAWNLPPTCVKKCPALESRNADIVCKYNGETVTCGSSMAPETKATLACKDYYTIGPTVNTTYSEITCLEDGTWNNALIHCIPECGIAEPREDLIVNGTTVDHGSFPWHVGIYEKNWDEDVVLLCTGTLISPSLVITVAHSFYDDNLRTVRNARDFAVAAGKYYRLYNVPELYAQKSRVKRIDVTGEYSGRDGSVAEDIALLHLETPFTMTVLVRPICMDWDNKFEENQLQIGKSGKIVGWGRTLNGRSSSILQEVDLPYVPYDKCNFAIREKLMRYELTADKFCAGYYGGLNFCSNDRGNGLSFENYGRWYLRGVMSIEMTSSIVACAGYRLFTNVGHFLEWIRSAYTESGSEN